MFWNEIQARRADYLRLAQADAANWLSPPNVRVGSAPSDQFWLEQFAAELAEPVSESAAHIFFVTFRLNRFQWDKAKAARAIEKVRRSTQFEPNGGVVAFADELRKSNKRGARQTSAASKIANFVKPTSSIFIWDKLATRSARARDFVRSGGKGPLRSGAYRTADGDHDYMAYSNACRSALSEERRKSDFQSTLDQLTSELRESNGPVTDSIRIPDSFIERRLLDKLMFWEGWALHRSAHPQIKVIDLTPEG